MFWINIQNIKKNPQTCEVNKNGDPLFLQIFKSNETNVAHKKNLIGKDFHIPVFKKKKKHPDRRGHKSTANRIDVPTNLFKSFVDVRLCG